MRMLGAVASIVLLVASAGCFTTRYYNFPSRPDEQEATDPHAWGRRGASGTQPFFLYGWIPVERVIPADLECGAPENIWRIETEQSASDYILTTITMGIYTPWTGKVICK